MSVSIRSRLLLLVLSVMIPSLLGVAWLIASIFDTERQAHERMMRDTARALSMVVDGELSRRAAIARVLAQSRWLDGAPELSADELSQFEQVARRSIHGMDAWVELWAPGRVVLNTRPADPGKAAPSGWAPASALLDRPRVLALPTAGPGLPGYAAHVEPVRRERQALLNLAVTLPPTELQRLVDAQALPAQWIGTVLDHQGRVVARHPADARHLGRPATGDLRQRLADASEGRFESVSLDGMPVTGYYSTAPSGWTYVSAMPRRQVAGFLPEVAAQLGVGALLLAAGALAATRWLSRRIVEPVLKLKTAALNMQSGLPVDKRPTGIAECDDVAAALADAARSLQDHRAELQLQVNDAVSRTRLAEQRLSQSQRVEALGRLTSGVAHDFNNLLGVISNSAHLIERHPAATELRPQLAATLRAVDVGSQLTQHLLRYAGQRAARPQVLQLASYLPDLQELLHSVLGRRITLTVAVDSGTAPVYVEPGDLELVLINLALNARDAMPDGGTLRVAASHAAREELDAMALPADRTYVRISVADDGTGIDPAQLPRVFEPFFTTKAVGKGTGLGLSQVQGFCSQAGGAARVDSTPGRGTTVSLLLPASEAVASDQPAPAPGPSAVAVTEMRVLLVEDNDDLGDVTAALLRSHGAVVHRVSQATDALRVLRTRAGVDVVLTDVLMPGDLDGVALARQIRRAHPEIAVVLISGCPPGAELEFTVLGKPCPPDALLAALRAAVAGMRPSDRLAGQAADR